MSKVVEFRGYKITLDKLLKNEPYNLIWNKEKTTFIKLVDYEGKVYQIKTLVNKYSNLNNSFL